MRMLYVHVCMCACARGVSCDCVGMHGDGVGRHGDRPSGVVNTLVLLGVAWGLALTARAGLGMPRCGLGMLGDRKKRHPAGGKAPRRGESSPQGGKLPAGGKAPRRGGGQGGSAPLFHCASNCEIHFSQPTFWRHPKWCALSKSSRRKRRLCGVCHSLVLCKSAISSSM